VEKVTQQLGILLQLKKLTKINIRPIGENSHNLVTLSGNKRNLRGFEIGRLQAIRASQVSL
jgi:hypothetical protein